MYFTFKSKCILVAVLILVSTESLLAYASPAAAAFCLAHPNEIQKDHGAVEADSVPSEMMDLLESKH